MRKVSNEFINLSKKIKAQDLKLSINEGELTVQEVHLMPVNIFNAMPVSLLKARKQVIVKELKYNFEGQLFKTIMQQIEITVKNANEIKGKLVNFQYGISINNEFEYVDMGEYYIKDVEDDKKKEELVVTGYDKMLNFMVQFKQTDLQLTYPCKMSQLVSRIGEVCGVQLYSTDFYNSDLIVDEDFFTIQELTYRDVLEKVAQTTLTTIFIKENKLYLCRTGDSVQILDSSFLSNLVVGEKFGPVNALVLGRGSVEDNIESINQQSINLNGRCEIRFDENEFIDSKREEVIDEMFQQINGLEYYAIEASNLGLLWLEPCDVIIAKDREENEYKAIYLKANVTINIGIQGEMESNIPESTTTEYKITTKEQKKTLKVERMAKKHEGIIQDLIEENSEHSQKLTKVEQDVNSITQQVQDMEDLTNTAEGIKTITLENCIEGNLLELHIFGNNSVFKYLHVSDNLYLSDDLLLYGDSRIVVADKENKQKIYDLGVLDTLRQNGAICDEYILEKGKARIIRRIAKDGSILQKEKVEELGDFSIKISEGKNTITIKNYSAKLNAKYAIKTEYSEVFATKVEMNSSITQTAEEIKSEVNKKVDGEEFGTYIQQNAEAIRIAWNQISQYFKMEGINGKATLNIYDKNNKILMRLNDIGQEFYYNDAFIGYMGTASLASDNSKRGLSFNLNAEGSFIDFAFDKNNDGEYTPKIRYSKNDGVTINDKLKIYDELKVYSNLDMEGYEVRGVSNLIKTDIVESINMPEYASDRSFIVLDFTTKNNGTFRVQVNASDGRLKKNIKNTSITALDVINSIKHREFNWKNSEYFQELGYIAQELEQVNEKFITKVPQIDEEGNTIDYLYQVSDKDIMPYVTKALQELYKIQQDNRNELEKQKELLKIIAEKNNLEKEYNNIFSDAVKPKKVEVKKNNQEVFYNEEIKFTKIKKIEKQKPNLKDLKYSKEGK